MLKLLKRFLFGERPAPEELEASAQADIREVAARAGLDLDDVAGTDERSGGTWSASAPASSGAGSDRDGQTAATVRLSEVPIGAVPGGHGGVRDAGSRGDDAPSDAADEGPRLLRSLRPDGGESESSRVLVGWEHDRT